LALYALSFQVFDIAACLPVVRIRRGGERERKKHKGTKEKGEGYTAM
jgi:hypothetical protein